jgi:hypothetical protein
MFASVLILIVEKKPFVFDNTKKQFNFGRKEKKRLVLEVRIDFGLAKKGFYIQRYGINPFFAGV